MWSNPQETVALLYFKKSHDIAKHGRITFQLNLGY